MRGRTPDHHELAAYFSRICSGLIAVGVLAVTAHALIAAAALLVAAVVIAVSADLLFL